MSRTLGTSRHRALVDFIAEKREAAGLTQTDLAKKIRQHQSFVARVESGQRRIDVIEFIELAEAIGFDPRELITRLQAKRR